MKSFRITIAFVLLAGLALAAPPQEESRFLEAVRSAYSARDKDAIVALQCWDGVDASARQMFPRMLDFSVPTNEVVSVRYTTNYYIGFFTQTNGGVVYVPNLTPIKHIQIDFKADPPMHRFMGLSVGEKDGKLMITQMIPQK
jgi:hypothetical protein